MTELVLERAGRKFRPTVEQAEAFHRRVSGARYRLLGGYDDAPLGVLNDVEDEVMKECRNFVLEALGEGN